MSIIPEDVKLTFEQARSILENARKQLAKVQDRITSWSFAKAASHKLLRAYVGSNSEGAEVGRPEFERVRQ